MVIKLDGFKKLLNQKTNEIIKYQRECINKNNQLEKLKSAIQSTKAQKMQFNPSSISTKKTTTTLNKAFKYSSDKIKDFTEYDFDEEIQSDAMKSKEINKDLIDDSDEDQKDKKKLILRNEK